jgi:hypothetical protein
MYNYNIGDIVTNILPLEVDNRDHDIIPIGTKLRIVAIAPKVCMVKSNDGYHDNKQYFFNAVLTDQNNNDSDRIRANFCTIKKEK